MLKRSLISDIAMLHKSVHKKGADKVFSQKGNYDFDPNSNFGSLTCPRYCCAKHSFKVLYQSVNKVARTMMKLSKIRNCDLEL